MANTIAILLFDGAEEMDFAGPWEVFTAAVDRLTGERVMTVAETLRPVACEMGMRVLPDATYEDGHGIDVVVVPGGSGVRREIENPATVRWLTETRAKASWITSVCTGSFLLVGCGIARGRRVTTHHDFINALRDQGGAEVVEGVRFVRDGNLVSAAGVMSGIEMSLWLVGELYGGEVAERTKSYWPSIACSAFSGISIWRAAPRAGQVLAPRAASITHLINC